MIANAGLSTWGLLRVMAVPLCGHIDAQAAQKSRVAAAIASYNDTEANPRDPAKLTKILQGVRTFYAQASGGAHEFVADVHPTVLELSQSQSRPPGRCRLPDPARLSAALRDAGIDLSSAHALALVVPASAQGCNGGLQTAFRHRETDGSVRNVPLAVSWSLTDRFIDHEILHTHGLGHAQALGCRGASLAADCRRREYGNVWDVVGNGSFQMLSAPLRTLMGWTAPVVHAAGRATYTISAATRPGDLPTAVRAPLPFVRMAEADDRLTALIDAGVLPA